MNEHKFISMRSIPHHFAVSGEQRNQPFLAYVIGTVNSRTGITLSSVHRDFISALIYFPFITSATWDLKHCIALILPLPDLYSIYSSCCNCNIFTKIFEYTSQ